MYIAGVDLVEMREKSGAIAQGWTYIHITLFQTNPYRYHFIFIEKEIIKIENFVVKTMDFPRPKCALSGLDMYYNERYETENLKIIILKKENVNLKIFFWRSTATKTYRFII